MTSTIGHRVPQLAAGLLLSVLGLAGCGFGPTGPDVAAPMSIDPSAPVPQVGELTFVSGQQSQNGALLQELFTDFNDRATGNTVRLQINNDSDVQTAEKVLIDAAAGQLPDAVRVTNATYRLLVDAGITQPTEFCFAGNPALNRQLDADLLAATKVNGVGHQIPWYVTPNALLYNAELFRRAGLDPDTPPRTLNEVHTAAKAIAKLGGGIAGGVAYFGNDYNFQGYLTSGGARFLAPDGSHTGIDSAPGAEAFNLFAAMAADGSSPVYGNFFAEANDAFGAGRLGLFVSSTSTYAGLINEADFDLRMAPVPYPDGGTPLAVSSTNGFVITATDPDRQRATCAALMTLLSPEAVTKTVSTTVTIPLNTTATAGPRYLAPVLEAHPGWSSVLNQELIAWQALPGEGNAEYQDAYVDEQARVLRGESSGQEAAQRLGQIADGLLERR